jgi:hypothetical protein
MALQNISGSRSRQRAAVAGSQQNGRRCALGVAIACCSVSPPAQRGARGDGSVSGRLARAGSNAAARGWRSEQRHRASAARRISVNEKSVPASARWRGARTAKSNNRERRKMK